MKMVMRSPFCTQGRFRRTNDERADPHSCVADTYWYFQAAPMLMSQVADACQRHFEDVRKLPDPVRYAIRAARGSRSASNRRGTTPRWKR